MGWLNSMMKILAHGHALRSAQPSKTAFTIDNADRFFGQLIQDCADIERGIQFVANAEQGLDGSF
jgi:hypothetical protein